MSKLGRHMEASSHSLRRVNRRPFPTKLEVQMHIQILSASSCFFSTFVTSFIQMRTCTQHPALVKIITSFGSLSACKCTSINTPVDTSTDPSVQGRHPHRHHRFQATSMLRGRRRHCRAPQRPFKDSAAPPKRPEGDYAAARGSYREVGAHPHKWSIR